jgi:hypothetical protein
MPVCGDTYGNITANRVGHRYVERLLLLDPTNPYAQAVSLSSDLPSDVPRQHRDDFHSRVAV